MPLLSFDVYSNYEEVQRLRSEITMLENRLKSFGPGTSVSTIRAVEAQLQSARAKFKGLALDAAQAGASIEMNIRKGANGAINAINDLQQKLTNPIQGLTQIAGVAGLGMFLNNVQKIRGQFQKMETNINTLLGSADKGKAMMADLTEYAKVSPLDFQGTVGAAQMMLGFGIDQQKILPFMKALGDVSMGDAQRFQSLTLAFSQMSAAGKLMGQDLMQMVNAGFQPLDQLAKDTGKSIGQLKEEMSQGKISAEMVQQAFINATSEGGKFFNMSQAATATISGQMSMLGDATDLMFNDLGKHSEDAIIKVIEGATWMVENYEKVGGVLGTAIATFGIYKASAMASEFAIKAASEEKSKAVVQGFEEEIAKMEEYRREQALMAYDDDVRKALETGSVSDEMADKIQLLREEVKAKKEAAQEAVDAAQKEQSAINDALKSANEKVDKAQEMVDMAEQIGTAEEKEAAASELLSAQMEREALTTQLADSQKKVETAQTALKTASTQADTIAEIQNTNATNINTAAQNTNTAATGRGRIATALSTAGNKIATIAQYAYTSAINACTKAWNSMKLAMATNPIGLLLTFASAIAGAIMTIKGFIGSTEEASAEVERFGESAIKTKRNIDTLYAVLDSVSKESNVYKDSLAELTKIAKEYGIVIDSEKDTLDQLIQKRGILNDLILKEGEARQIANRIATYQEDKKGYVDDFIKKMTENIDDNSRGDAEDNAGRFAQMIADKVERDLQDIENGKIKGLVAHWDELEKELKGLQSEIQYDETGELSAEYYPKMEQLRKDIGQVQDEIAKAANSEAKDFATQMGMVNDYQLDIKDTAQFVKELTDKVVMTDSFIKQTKDNAQAVNQELESMKAPEPDFSAVGMDVTNLVKNFKEFKKQLDSIDETEVKPKVDASDIDKTTESATDAKNEVDNLDSSTAAPSTDTTQIDATTDSATAAAGAMSALDKTSAEPVIKTKWLDGFTKKINEAWVGLQKFMGVENPEPLIKDNQSNSEKSEKTQSQKAQQAVTDIKSEFSKKIANAKTTNQMTEIRKGINELMGDLEQNSADYKYFEGLLKSLDKRDKTKNKGGSKNDPKQAEYEARKARIEEERRINELLLEEQNRQYQLQLDMRRDSSDKEIDVIKFEAKKKREALLKERQKEADRLKEFDRQQWLKSGKNRKAYQWEQTKTDDEYIAQAGQNIGFNTQSSMIDINEEDSVRKIQNEIANTMLSYLKEFGTFQQKRYAIEQEYTQKIAEARNAGERLMLESQKKQEFGKLDIEALKQQIDWGSLFGDFGTMLSDQVQPTIDKLEAITKTDDFRNSTFEEQKAVFELISSLKGSITKWDNDIFSALGNAVSVYQTALHNNEMAIEDETKARETAEDKRRRLNEIEEKNHQSLLHGQEADIEEENKARQEASDADNALTQAAKRTAETTTEVANAQQNLTDATSTASDMFSQFASGLQGLASGSLQGVWNGMNQLSKLFNGSDNIANKMGIALLKGIQKLFGDDSNIGKAVSESLSSLGGPILGEITGIFFSILDIFKDGIGNFIASLIDTVLGAVNGLLNSVLSGEIVTSVGKSIIQGIGNILDTISFGGFSSLMNKLGISGDSDKNLKKDIERLTATNEALRKAVDNLASEMRDAATADMGDIYKQQKQDIEQSMKNTQEMMSRSGSAYSNGFLGIGGHKSSNHKINDGMSSSDWSRITSIVGKSVKSASDFWNLTSEQMAKIADTAPDLYAKIKSLADDGYKDAAQFMDEYIEYYKELEELEKSFRESLTDVSFDSVKDDFKSLLLDMESDSKDFASNWEKMMQQAVVNSLMNSKYNKMLKSWYQNFADAIDNDVYDGDNPLTSTEQANLKSEWDNIVKQAIAERDSLKAAMGWDSGNAYSQEASKAGVTTISEDTGVAIVGRMTAMQEAVESIKASESVSVLTLADMTDELIEIAMEYSRFNVHQDNIERQLAKIYIELQTISENTGAIIKPIFSMQESLHRIESHTKNL